MNVHEVAFSKSGTMLGLETQTTTIVAKKFKITETDTETGDNIIEYRKHIWALPSKKHCKAAKNRSKRYVDKIKH